MVRTDFSGPTSRERPREALAAPNEDGFLPHVELVDDPRFAGMTCAEARNLLLGDHQHRFLVLADTVTLSSIGLPVAVVDLRDEPGRFIRVVAAELRGIENNVSIANMGFGEFADAVDEDGVSWTVPGVPLLPRLELEPTMARAGVLDGARWPCSNHVLAELPDLVTALGAHLGRIARVGLDTPAMAAPRRPGTAPRPRNSCSAERSGQTRADAGSAACPDRSRSGRSGPTRARHRTRPPRPCRVRAEPGVAWASPKALRMPAPDTGVVSGERQGRTRPLGPGPGTGPGS
ncbi:DUF5994 family protein [Kitasatospora sp. NPDC127116]|uniref:DUF5994 family protein n=1 Tax=Kitasatospora sp. NPDC127116 TaxID=3345367 RepID=UPI00362E913C